METKVKAAAAGALAGGLTLTPLVLYLMVLAGAQRDDPLVVGAAGAIAGLLTGGASLLVGWWTRSTTSTASHAFDLTAQPADVQRRVLAQASRLTHTPQASPRSAVRPPAEAGVGHGHLAASDAQNGNEDDAA